MLPLTEFYETENINKKIEDDDDPKCGPNFIQTNS